MATSLGTREGVVFHSKVASSRVDMTSKKPASEDLENEFEYLQEVEAKYNLILQTNDIQEKRTVVRHNLFPGLHPPFVSPPELKCTESGRDRAWCRKPLETDKDKKVIVVYHVILHCTETGTSSKHDIELHERPVTMREVMTDVELFHHVPISKQTVTYKGRSMKPQDKLANCGVKDGDTFKVIYDAKCQLDALIPMVNWFQFLSVLLKRRSPSLYDESGVGIDIVIRMGVKDALSCRKLRYLFSPWDNPEKEANRAYFMEQDVMKDIFDSIHVLLAEPWRTMLIRLKFLEVGLISVVGYFVSSGEHRFKVVQCDGLGMILQSFIRVRLRRGVPIQDSSGAPGNQEHNDHLLKNLISNAVTSIVCFRECKQLHEDVADNPDFIEQFLCVVLSPSTSTELAMKAMCILANCVHSPDTARHYCRPGIIEGLMEVGKARSSMGIAECDYRLLRFFSQLIFAHMYYLCKDVISKRYIDKMHDHFDKISRGIDAESLKESVVGSNLWMTTYKPYLDMIFTKKVRENPHKLTSKLKEPATWQSKHYTEMLSITSIVYLNLMMYNSKVRDIHLQNKLGDFFLIIPWTGSHLMRYHGRLLLETLSSSGVALQPPKLSSMCRITLAREYFGFERAMSMSCEQMAKELKLVAVSKPDQQSLVYIISVQSHP